jgi:hypothetical protein
VISVSTLRSTSDRVLGYPCRTTALALPVIASAGSLIRPLLLQLETIDLVDLADFCTYLSSS